MKETELNKVLNYMKQYVENKYEHDSEPMLTWKDLKLVLNEIDRLNETIEELNNKEEEIERLNNIINELEKKLLELRLTDVDGKTIVYRLLDILKGSGKE